MFQTILIEPLTFVLTTLAPQVGGYGIAIILVTLGIRLILLPLTLPSIKTAAKIRDLQPEINRLKKQYGQDKAALQKAQMELFQQHKLNPAGGCLPNIIQLVVLISLYRVFNAVATGNNLNNLDQFLWLNIAQPDSLFILPIIAGATQLILGLMLLPAADATAELAQAATTKDKSDDKPAEDMASMAQNLQQQMVFIMPAMTVFLAARFPSGLALYWVTTTLFSLAQQYAVSGWGGLPQSLKSLLAKIPSRGQ